MLNYPIEVLYKYNINTELSIAHKLTKLATVKLVVRNLKVLVVCNLKIYHVVRFATCIIRALRKWLKITSFVYT